VVADLAAYLAGWERVFGGAPLPASQLAELVAQSPELRDRARGVGFGGVAHHLDQCSRFLSQAGVIDPDGLRSALKDLSELAWQAKQELTPDERALVERALFQGKAAAAPAPAALSGALAPPPMITQYPSGQRPPPRADPSPAVVAGMQPPPLLGASMIAPSPARDPEGFRPSPAAPLPPLAQPVAPLPPAVAQREPSAAAKPRPVDPDLPPVSQGPKLAVRTMFGLRAFGRAPAPANPGAAPPNAPDKPSVLNLRGFSEAPRPMASQPPPMLSASLPPLPGRPLQGQGAPMQPPMHPSAAPTDIQNLLGRIQGASDTGRKRTGRSKAKPAGRYRPARSSSTAYWLLGLAVLVAGVLVAIIVFVATRLRQPVDSGRSASANPTSSSARAPSLADSSQSQPAAAATPSTGGDDALRALLSKAHTRGRGEESPELKAWVDQQATMQAKLLETGKCEGSAAACSALFRQRGDVAQGGKTITKRKSATGNGGLRSRWLAGLKMPDKFPVEDDPRVQHVFEKYTDTQVGRALFESMLFRCGSYRDRIEETLIRYELPQSLLAVVFAESGCDPLAKSPVGAEGLWQFMPEAGRAYHLHIVEEVIDERHSPPKSTEAAIHFLSDLHKKFGSWDLVFAAYNMGPYGLVARQQRAGGDDVGFWDLLDADLLPNETAQYVPIIEAFALILENLQRLKFADTQMRAPEVTADLDTPPGTRLSLIAEAAATSVNQLRLLNLDVKGDNVPNIPGQLFPVQVPKDVVWQARDKLQALTTHAEYRDQCVSAAFDWGKQRFTQEMEEECRKRFLGQQPRPTSSGR
jgi:hypothetical protein